MEAEQRRAAREQMIALMQAGYRWQQAAAQAGIQISRSTAGSGTNEQDMVDSEAQSVLK